MLWIRPVPKAGPRAGPKEKKRSSWKCSRIGIDISLIRKLTGFPETKIIELSKAGGKGIGALEGDENMALERSSRKRPLEEELMSIEKFEGDMGTVEKTEIRSEVKGWAGGEAKRKEELAMPIIKQGVSISLICELTGLSQTKIIELSKGMAESKTGTKKEVAIKMLNEGLNTFLVSKITGLPEAKVTEMSDRLEAELMSMEKFKLDMAAIKKDAVDRASAKGWAKGWAKVRTGGKVKKEKELAIAMLKEGIDSSLICEITEFSKGKIVELSKSVAEDRTEGEVEGIKEMAIAMLKEGVDIPLVCKITKLPKVKVVELSEKTDSR